MYRLRDFKMIFSVLDVDPLLCVLLQHSREEVLSLWRDVRRGAVVKGQLFLTDGRGQISLIK